MARMHLKRLSAPKSWPIARKSNTFIIRPHPGSHGFAHGTSISTFLIEMTQHVSSASEVRKVLAQKQVLIDGVARTSTQAFVGILDTVELPALKKAYRLVLDTRGKLKAVAIPHEEAKTKVAKIIGKTYQKDGKLQLNLHDGSNIVIKENDSKTGDGVVLSLPSRVPESYIKLEKDAIVYLNGGSHQGLFGKVVDVEGNQLKLHLKEGTVTTPKKYAMVIGKGKPLISVN